MTSIAHPLAVQVEVRPRERTASSSIIGCACMLPALILRGIGLGFVGLAVVLTVTAALIGVHEIQRDASSSSNPPTIHYN